MEGESFANNSSLIQLIRINPREFQLNKNAGFSIPLGGLEGIEKLLKI